MGQWVWEDSNGSHGLKNCKREGRNGANTVWRSLEGSSHCVIPNTSSKRGGKRLWRLSRASYSMDCTEVKLFLLLSNSQLQ